MIAVQRPATDLPTDNRPTEADLKAPPVVRDDKDEFLTALWRDGFAIARGVATPEKAAEYVDAAHSWLEGFNMGYKRDDPSTWDVKNLPRHGKGGLYSWYSIAHAQFVWDLKTNPEYIKYFERIWGTKELCVSYDGAYLGVPLPKEQVEGQNKPWPHTDQSPYRPDLYCVQSLMNLLPNNEKDGGLWVLKGSAPLFGEVIEHFKLQENCPNRDHIRFDEDIMQFLYDKGCEWVHPNLQPGDVVFWDSRCVHSAAAPESGKHRFAVYTCYKPASQLTGSQLEKKKEAFEKGYVTSHDPISFDWKDNSDSKDNILFPYGKPKLSEQQLKYASVKPW